MSVVAYCTLADVQTYMPKVTFTAISHPSSTEVLGYAMDIAADMRGVLDRGGYEVVTTDADALRQLKLIAVFGTAALAEKAAFPGSDSWLSAWELYKQGIARIRAGELFGLATESGSELALPRSGYTANPSTYPEPRFKFGVTQW